jgi:hypothetical protein
MISMCDIWIQYGDMKLDTIDTEKLSNECCFKIFKLW